MSRYSEGWCGENYFILFSEADAVAQAGRYGMTNMLAGFHLIGLRAWDDFIVKSQTGLVFRVPAVPCDSNHPEPRHIPDADELVTDDRFTGKVKWYLKPIAFGGDPSQGDNLIWVTRDQHCELVRWWNGLYRDLTRQTT
jgi:hypothetical protein